MLMNPAKSVPTALRILIVDDDTGLLDAMQRSDMPAETPLNVIYLNALSDDERKQVFVASLASKIYRWMVSSLDAGTGRPLASRR